jgi:DnaJ family protein A protein 2
LHLKTEKGDIIKPGEVKMIPNEGMPTHKRPFEKGSLFVQFNIEFPKPGYFEPKALEQLEKLLPPRRPVVKPAPDHTVAVLQKVPQTNDKNGKRQSRRESYESGDEDEEPRGGVQCTQQ